MTLPATDLSANSSKSRLRINGHAASTPPHAQDRVTAHLAAYFKSRMGPRAGLSGNSIDENITQVSRSCLILVRETLDRRAVPDAAEFDAIREVTARWAHDATPLTMVLRGHHEAVRMAFGLVSTTAQSHDVEELRTAGDLMLGLLNAITTEVTETYVAGQCHTADMGRSNAQNLASALLAGRSSRAMARHAGRPIADAYQVVALAIPDRPEEDVPAAASTARLHCTVCALQSAVDEVFASRGLALLSAKGGTLLVALGPGVTTPVCPTTMDRLATAAGIPLTATVITSNIDQVPEAADQAHELLSLVQTANRAPGLYQPSDLDIEYQVTRGGPVTRRIATLLDPLLSHPGLLDTVRTYLATDMDRQSTARQMRIHPNTVDNRLRRITELTSLDLATSSGICRATIALLAYEHRHR